MCIVFLNIRHYYSQNILKIQYAGFGVFCKKFFVVLFFTNADWGLPVKTDDRLGDISLPGR